MQTSGVTVRDTYSQRNVRDSSLYRKPWRQVAQCFIEPAGHAPHTAVDFRGDRPTARDLFDLCLVIEREPESLIEAGAFPVRHRDTFLRLLNEHRTFVQPRFDDIRTRGCTPSLDSCVELADAFLQKLPGGTPGPKSRRRQPRPRPRRSACAPSRHDRVRPPASMRCRDTGARRAGRRRARASSAGCRQVPRKPAKRTAPSPAKPRLPGASAHVKSRRTHLKMQCSNSQKCKNE